MNVVKKNKRQQAHPVHVKLRVKRTEFTKKKEQPLRRKPAAAKKKKKQALRRKPAAATVLLHLDSVIQSVLHLDSVRRPQTRRM